MDRRAEVLNAVATVVSEMRGVPVVVDPTATLDKDLGLDSLSRIELLSRLETTFSVTLSDAVFAEAETPNDLMDAIDQAAPSKSGVSPVAEAVGKLSGGDVAIPTSAATLVDVIDAHAAQTPERVHITLYEDDADGDSLTFAALARGAERMAAGLQGLGLEAGQAVAIMLPTGRDYFFTFLGVLKAGGVPVPVYPPGRPAQLEEHMRRHLKIIANCAAPVMVTMAEATSFSALLTAHVDTLIHVVTPGDVVAKAGRFRPVVVHADDTAFIQYTSGSTGDPKGVVLSHGNLLANVRAMGQAAAATPDDVFISWLPLYHDMGLIGAWFGSLYCGAHLVIMSPLAFLSRPRRWLAAMTRYGGTISAAPNFAYDLCLRRLSDEDLDGLDLSRWRCALNGAEAVSPQTVTAFIEKFSAVGFKPEAAMPVYGLAENSVGVAFPPLGRAPVIDRIQRRAFMGSGRAEPATTADSTALSFPACGHALPGHEIRVVDPAGRELPDRREGRIQFKGPSSTAGYLHAPEASAALFDGDWLNSGDLGYLVHGDVFVTGRSKDVIIRGGRNIYPAEIEEAVGTLEGIQAGNVAAFGSPDPDTGTERLIVLAESRKRKPEARDALTQTVNAVVTDLTGSPPDMVVLAPPRTVPKTSSGKIRRSSAREIFESGAVGKPAVAVWWQITRLALAGVLPSLKRKVAQVGALLFAGYVYLLVAVLIVPTWAWVMLAPGMRLRWAGVRGILWLLAVLSGTRWQVRGAENLPPQSEPVIVVVNHMSYLDGLALSGLLGRPLRFVAKGELAGAPLVGAALQRLGTQFVERFDRTLGAEDAERLAAQVTDGTTVYFPEGTFTRQAGLLPFRLGAFAAAVQTAVPIVPIALRGTRPMLRGDDFFPRPGRIDITIGTPLTSDPNSDPWHAG